MLKLYGQQQNFRWLRLFLSTIIITGLISGLLPPPMLTEITPAPLQPMAEKIIEMLPQPSAAYAATIAEDDFSTGDYSGGTGWSNDWNGLDPTDTGSGHTSGNIKIDSSGNCPNGGSSSPCLSFKTNQGNNNTLYSERAVNLTGIIGPILNFEYDNRMSNEATMELQVSTDNGSTYSTLLLFSGTNLRDHGSASVALPTSDVIIRFVQTEAQSNGTTDTLYIDNVEITGTQAPTPEPVSNTVTGFVFKEHNLDGVRDADEPGIPNATVEIIDADGDVYNTTTDANGNYTVTDPDLNGEARVTIELPAGSKLLPTIFGIHNGTTVQFVDVSSGNAIASAGFAIAQANTACDTSGAIIAVACYENGSGDGNTGAGFVSFDYYAEGRYPGSGTTPSMDAEIQDIGAVWGTAYRPSTKLIYTAAFLKRHVGLGPLADSDAQNETVDGIYLFDYSSGAGVPSGGFTLQGVSGIDVGTIRRQGDTNGRLDNDYELLDDATEDNVDLQAFSKIGQVGYGDIDISEDGNTLWMVNLNQRTLISVDLNDPANPIPSDGSAAPAGAVNQYPILDPGCSDGDYRPWGLKFYNGNGYLGVVCSAETSQSTNDLHAYVLSFDPNNPASGYTSKLSFPLDYTREKANPTTSAEWQPWAEDWADTDFGQNIGGEQAYPQPILSDIEFTDNGSMVLGFMDRWAHQMGYQNVRPLASGWDYRRITANAAGDILHFCNDNSGSWTMEGTGNCTVNDPGGVTNTSLNNDGPSGNGEFYYQDDYFQYSTGFYHNEVATGALARLPGENEIVATIYDPQRNTSSAFTQGIRGFNSITGRQERWYDFVPSGSSHFGKAGGLGDLEIIMPNCDVGTPVEIGNRVWRDDNGNGIQDAGEPPIAGVTIELLDGSGTVIATAITDLAGEYYFGSQDGIDSAAAKYGLPLEFDTIGVYSVRVPNAEGSNQQSPIANFELTTADQGSHDALDSDATLNNNDAIIAVDTTANDHTYDIGFIPFFDLALRKTSNVQAANPGTNIVFSLEIFNQGQRPADNIQLIDYLPADLTLNDSDWSASGSDATITLNSGDELPVDGLQPGESIVVPITVQANSGLNDGDIVINHAEISGATDISGNPVTDIDSTPDSNDGNDIVIDNTVDNSANDEDDHDPAQVTIVTSPIYDLALRKRLADDQPKRVTIGQDVTYVIDVFNQGTVDATNVELVDRYPTGFSLSDNDNNGWADQGNGTATVTLPSGLMAGASTAIEIVLTAGTTLGDLQNSAEILNDDSGENDVDSDPESEDGNGDGDALMDDIYDQSPPDDEDDHDIAEVTVYRYDLALRKQVAANQPSVVAPGSDITFIIEVINQGNVDAYDIVVADYLATGLSLSPNDGNGWSKGTDGVVLNTLLGPVAPNATQALSITVSIAPTATLGALTNLAEIVSGAELPGGPPAEDTDSTPDQDPDNDTFVTDDDIDGDGSNGGDEDDQDPATITVAEFDLALTKAYVSDTSGDGNATDGIIQVGDQINFSITVFNQGNVPAYDVEIVDYIPTGFYMDDSNDAFNVDQGWEANDGLVNGTAIPAAFNTLPGPIPPGGSASVNILLVLAGPNSIVYTGDPIGTHENWAEIVQASDRPDGDPVIDADSTPNFEQGDDTFGGDDLTDNSGGDEDDHDVAEFEVQPGFDLALINYLDSDVLNEALQPKLIYPSDLVTYTIVVENQGLIMAQDISIIDYLPEGFTLADSDWTSTTAGTLAAATRDFTNVNLQPGDRMSTTIVLQAGDDITPGQLYYNWAEISGAVDNVGAVATDVDSLADANLINDVFSTDNFFRGNGLRYPGVSDEDDHDPAVVMVAPADWGDLPDGNATDSPSYNTYLTSTVSGPSHPIFVGLQIGPELDIENDGVPSPDADGDDMAGGVPDDEDGVAFPDFAPGQSAPVTVTVTHNGDSPAYLYGFIDFDGDGLFTTPGEALSQTVPANSNNIPLVLNYSVPTNADHSQSLGARFRLSTDDDLGPDGPARDGEIEDYLIELTAQPEFTLSKVVNTPPPALIGRPVSFTIQIVNSSIPTLVNLPLTDIYDTNYLSYVTASPTPDESSNGQLVWHNLTQGNGSIGGFGMNLASQETFEIVVEFIALQDTTGLPNDSTVNNATVLDQSDNAEIMIFNPTNVVLSRREVAYKNGNVVVEWETADETEVVSFDIYRAVSGDDDSEPIKLNQAPLFAENSGSAKGAVYLYEDETAQTDINYTYSIAILDVRGLEGIQELGEVLTVRTVDTWFVFLPIAEK